MKEFQPFDLSLARAEAQIAELRQLLADRRVIEEDGDAGLLAFFRARPDLLGLLARVSLGISSPNVIAHELDLAGFFRTDFAVGDNKRGEYLLIELEPADDNVFKRNSNKTKRDWHPRLNAGYSQLVDWLWLLSDVEHSRTLRSQFPNFSNFVALLVIGRDSMLNDEEMARLRWRTTNSTIFGHKVVLVTYDGALRLLQDEADALRRYGGR